jgi:hypothetical protein
MISAVVVIVPFESDGHRRLGQTPIGPCRDQIEVLS